MKTALIYLAAGNSRRFGSNKLLYQWNGKPMYLHLLERLMEIADADERYELRIVTQYEEIKNQIGIFRQEGRRAACVWSPESEKGVSYSIRSGLFRSGVQEGRASEAKMQACAFFVADQPWLAKESVLGFLERMQNFWEIPSGFQRSTLGSCLNCRAMREERKCSEGIRKRQFIMRLKMGKNWKI